MQRRPKLTENRFDQWVEDLKSWITVSVSPFEDDTPAKKAARIKRGEFDLLYFEETYLPHYFTVEFGDFHQEWEALTEIKDEFVLVGAPREHAKSTFFTFGVPVRNICYVKRWFQLVISDTNDQASGFTTAIRTELETNPRIRNDFGDLQAPLGRRTVTWKKNDFLTANGVRVLARGHGEKVRGLKNRQHRPDFAVIDDFENDENVQNPKQVEKGKKWIRRAVIASMGAGYTALMVANLFHPKSVISQFIAEKDEEGNPLYVSRVYDCWIDYGKPDQRPLWPALWPVSRLEKKQRQMGTVDFNCEMRNLTGDENSPFPEAWFRYYEEADLIGKALVTASAVDPSGKSGENNDFKAIITVALDRAEMVFFVRHAWIRHASPRAMFAAADHQIDAYGGQIGIEENMFYDFLHEAIQTHAKETKRYLPWMPLKHSTNKEARIIGTLSYMVEYGKLKFLKGHSDQDKLVEQMIYLLNKNINDDGPDALETAVSLLQRSGGPAEYESVQPRRSFAETGKPGATPGGIW